MTEPREPTEPTGDLPDRLAALEAPSSLRLPPTAALIRTARSRRRRHRAEAGLVAAALVGAAALTFPGVFGDRSTQILVPVGPQPDVLPLGGRLPTACGTDVPLTVYTATPGAEQAETPEAAALREVLRTGIAGMVFPPLDGWVELTRTPDEVTYGHREGPIGIGEVVSVRRVDGAWGFGGSAGCGPVAYGDRTADVTGPYRTAGTSLTLPWTGGRGCGDDSNVADVLVRESAEEVAVVLLPQAKKPSPPDLICAGVGTREESTVTLAAPVGNRKVVNRGYVPAVPVLSEAESEEQRRRDDAEAARSQATCEAATATLGGTVSAAYPSFNGRSLTVADARTTITDLPAAWSSLPGGAPVVQCYLQTDPEHLLSVVIAESLPPYVYDRDHPVGGFYELLDQRPPPRPAPEPSSS